MDQIATHNDTKLIEIDPYTGHAFVETAKWTRIFAICIIVSMIMSSLLLLAMMPIVLKATPNINASQTAIITAVCIAALLLMVALYFYPIRALLNYSKLTKLAINSGDTVALKNATIYMRNMFRYLSILTVIGLALDIFLIVGMLAAASKL